MKKIFLLLSVLFSSLTMLAGSDVDFVKGNACIMNEAATCTIEANYTDLFIEGKPYLEHMKEKGGTSLKDWEDDVRRAVDEFIKEWNGHNKKGLRLTVDKSAANTYRMVIKMKKLNFGSSAASMFIGFGAGGAQLVADIMIYKGKDEVTRLKTDGVNGGSGISETSRMRDLFEEFAEDTVKTLKTACKAQR
jgi:hypothetical protein